MSARIWYRVDTGYSVAALIASDGTVVDAAPILRRFIGRRLTTLPAAWKIERMSE